MAIKKSELVERITPAATVYMRRAEAFIDHMLSAQYTSMNAHIIIKVNDTSEGEKPTMIMTDQTRKELMSLYRDAGWKVQFKINEKGGSYFIFS